MGQSQLARYPHSPWQAPQQTSGEKRLVGTIDRAMARAMVDAGYMPLRAYIEQFGFDPPGEGEVMEVGDHRSRRFH
jgi:hypothetical protein